MRFLRSKDLAVRKSFLFAMRKSFLFTILILIAANFPLLFSSAASLSGGGSRPVQVTAPAVDGQPELPRSYLNTKYVAPVRAPKFVAAGSDLQAAINSAQPGDVLTLQAGATFNGNFTLPAKSGSDWIIIRSSAPDTSLPAAEVRISPSYSNVMPKIVANNDLPAIRAVPGAHHYRFIGVEFTVGSAVTDNFNLIQLGNDETNLADLPHDFIFDRVYIHGNQTVNLRRALMLNAASSAVIDSYISDCHEVGADSQAIAAWSTPGPLKIVNNYLEGAAENLLIGGADPSVPGLVASDIEFRLNLCTKQLSWKEDEPNYGGIKWQVKNLLELKNAQRVLINGNVFEYNWAQAQSGFGILFTPRNQGGSAPQSVVQDITFTNNIVRHSGSGVNVAGYDDAFPSQPTTRILIRNNLFEDLDSARWGGDGRWLQIVGGPNNLTVDHNTSFQTGHIAIADGMPPGQFFVFTNNIAPHNAYGFFGSGVGTGTVALETYFPGAIFVRNAIISGSKSDYPGDNFFPSLVSDVHFVDQLLGNYRLAAESPYKNAGTDGKDLGCDLDAINAALSGFASVSSVSAASYFGQVLAAESIVVSFGMDLAGTTLPAATTPLPTVLGGVSIKITDRTGAIFTCPLFYVSPTQINYQIPANVAQGVADVKFLNGGNVAASGALQIGRTSAGLFSADSSGTGLPAALILRTKPNSDPVYEPVFQLDPLQNKLIARPIDLSNSSEDVFLILYGTGIRNRSALSNVSVNIGGNPYQVTYAGEQGTFTGLDQVNVRLDQGLVNRGDVFIDLTVDGGAANRMTVNIK